MANPLPEEKELYDRIRSEGIVITRPIWGFLYHRVNDNITAILLVCESCFKAQQALPVQEASRILSWSRDIKNTISAITTSSKDQTFYPQFKGASSLSPIIQGLITHQFGNDIYAIELMLQDAIYADNPVPVPLETVEKIIAHAQSIQGFLERFRDTVQWKESEEKYHNLYDSFRDGLMLTDMQGHIVEVNLAFLEMLHYSKEEITQLTCQQLTPEKWQESDKQYNSDLIAKKDDSVEYEKEYIQKDGTALPVALKVWLISDKDGNPLGMWSVVRDITERKRVQKEFEEEILASHAVIDNLSIGLSLSDKKGRFEIFNPSLQKITGYSMAEINNHDLGVLLYPDKEERQRAMLRLNTIAEGKGTANVETVIKDKSGQERILAVSTSLMNYKGSEMFLSIWRDITERRRLESALQDSETRFRRLFETAQDGILILEAGSGRITEVNKFLIDMLGYSRADFLGKQLWEVGAFVDREKSKAAFKELQARGYIRYEDLPLKTKDGRLIAVEFVSNRYSVDHTQVIQCNIRDITDRKHLEEERKELNKTLEQMVLKDSHTGFYNHRYLEEALSVNFSRAARQFAPLSLIMMDIDYFKSINDVYGHVFGDLVLKQFAAQLTEVIRPYDIVIRYGGEEFVIVSADTDRAGALVLANRILAKINAYSFGDKAHAIQMKISLAVASYPEDPARSGQQLLDSADRILNHAKENGGNRVCSVLDLRIADGLLPKTSDIHAIKEKIHKLTRRVNQSLIEEIFAFAKTVESKDCYEDAQIESIARYAVKISEEMKVSGERLESIKEASMLHDLGKVGIKERILHKKSKLSEKEFEEIKKHPQISADIIRPIQALRPVVPIVLHHHERWDGKGYPYGLMRERIPLGARIIALTDVYRALVTDRPYRKAYSTQRAVAIVKKASGTQFDPDIVRAFVTVLEREK